MRESQSRRSVRVFSAIAVGAAISVVLAGCATAISGTPTRAVTGFPSASAAAGASASAIATDSPDPTPDPSGSTDTADGSDDGNSPQVVPLLLTVADMPAGWTVDNSSDDGGDDSSDGPDCLQNLLGTSDSSVEGEADFVHNATPLAFVTETVTIDDSAAKAQQDYNDTIGSLAGCKAFSYKDDDGDTVRGAITALALTARGDQSSGFRVTLSGGTAGLYFDVQLARKGATLLALLVGGTAVPALATVEQLSAKAAAKLP